MKKLTLILLILLLATYAYAAIPHLIRYQGTAVDKDKTPLDGPYNITFRIYDVETAGTPLWEETQELVPISNGIFSVLLGNVNPLDLPFDKDYFLSVEINTDGEMFPRQSITSVGYAYRAEYAENISGVTVSQTPTPNNLLPLDVDGNLPISVIPQGLDSGLDADLLDGQSSSYYLNLANHTGTIPLQQGGTGAFLTNDPGGVLYCGTSTLRILADGAQGKFLQSGGQGAPTWQKINLQDNSQVTGVLPAELGGTGLGTATKGDIIYASGINAWAKLPAGTQGQYLQTQGPGTDPAWADVTVPAMTLVKAEDVSNVSSYTFSNLDGNADGNYMLTFHGYMDTSSSAGGYMWMRLNNDSGGGSYWIARSEFGYFSSGQTPPDFIYSAYHILPLFSRAVVDSTERRLYIGLKIFIHTATAYPKSISWHASLYLTYPGDYLDTWESRATAGWRSNAENLTSILIRTEGHSSLRFTGKIALYRIKP